MLVKNFYIVFEAIIDELIGDNPLPDGMDKKQEDGKIVDHLYTAKSLIEGDTGNTYYIGDSKYYKMGHELSKESIYKQYTYARNVIQWNLDLFNDPNSPNPNVKLRDDVTEGYNIIPNFFVSAKMNEHFDYTSDDIEKTDRRHNRHSQSQFSNRLFDRDTLLLFHYDVNFLFVLALYARNNASQKAAWKAKMRDRFRREIQEWLQDDYQFYAMRAKQGVNAKEYFEAHFRDILGKAFTPFTNEEIYSLALDKADEAENEALLTELRKYFFVEPCSLGENPDVVLSAATAGDKAVVSLPNKSGVLMVMMEQYDNKSKNFLGSGKIAIGVKLTPDSMEIVENISTISYVLFHHRSAEGQHLFQVKGDCVVKPETELESDRYKNISTTQMFIVADLDLTELDSSQFHSNRKSYTSTARYDAQYARIEELY